jgi:hypothetical protein
MFVRYNHSLSNKKVIIAAKDWQLKEAFENKGRIM